MTRLDTGPGGALGTPIGRGRPGLGPALALALLALPALVAAPRARAEATPGQKAYMEGVRAREVGDCGRAIGLLRQALREDGAEGLKKFRFEALTKEDYLPHFYLGLCLADTGQNAEALRELQESQRQGAVAGLPGSSRILAATIRRLEAATAPKVAVRPTEAPTPAPIPTAATGRPPAAPTAAPLAAATPAPSGPGPVHRPAAPPTPIPVAAPPASSGERLASLREALRAFFRGEYSQAVRRLEPLATVDPTARQFLAFSLAGSYLVDGSRDAAALSRARSELAAARAAGASLAEPDLVSPAIRSLAEGK